MFKKGEKLTFMRRLVQRTMLMIFLVGMASCAYSQPDEEFLNLSVGIAFSNGIVSREKEVTVKEFIDAFNKEGKWKKEDSNQWI